MGNYQSSYTGSYAPGYGTAVAPVAPAAGGIAVPAGTAAVDNGKVYYDGSLLTQGFTETFNQSRSAAELAADGWTVNEPGTSTATEGASGITFVTDTTHRDWFNGTYGGPSITRRINPRAGSFFVYVSFTNTGAAATGVKLVIVDAGADANFVDVNHYDPDGDAVNSQFYMLRGPATVLGSYDNMAGAGWMGLYYDGSTFITVYSTNGVGDEPTDDEWIWGAAPAGSLSYTAPATWDRLNWDLKIMGRNNPNGVSDAVVGKVVLRYL